jgi:hypothetical protein
MRKKKIDLQYMSLEDLMEMAQQYEERCQRRNARRRERRKWLKNAPREQTALKYHAQERPCSIPQYVQVERSLLGFLDEYPLLKGDAIQVLLALSHNILHVLHPEVHCAGTTLADCAFSMHELCSTALEIAMNFRPDPAFKLTHDQIFEAMMAFTGGVDKERLHFNAILGDLSIDL